MIGTDNVNVPHQSVNVHKLMVNAGSFISLVFLRLNMSLITSVCSSVLPVRKVSVVSCQQRVVE
jgi:hypothetical protein